MKAIFPSPGFSLAKVRLIFALLFMKPRQLGPIKRIFSLFNFVVIRFCNSAPSGPTSPNPADIITTLLTSFSTHWSKTLLSREVIFVQEN